MYLSILLKSVGSYLYSQMSLFFTILAEKISTNLQYMDHESQSLLNFSCIRLVIQIV